MTLKTNVENYLNYDPRFRERRNKDKGIINLLMEKHGVLRDLIESHAISRETLIDIIQDYTSMDRYWRLALMDNPSLQGSDYKDGKELARQKQTELEYEAGHYKRVKQMDLL